MTIPVEEHFARLERMYLQAPINRSYEPKLKIEREAATLEITIKPEMHHAVDAELHDHDGNRIAHGSGTFVRSSIALIPGIGYL